MSENAEHVFDEKATDKAGGNKLADAANDKSDGTDDADHKAAIEAAEAEGKTVLVGKVIMVDGPDIFGFRCGRPRPWLD